MMMTFSVSNLNDKRTSLRHSSLKVVGTPFQKCTRLIKFELKEAATLIQGQDVMTNSLDQFYQFFIHHFKFTIKFVTKTQGRR
eukprot:1153614-Pelagomonas_calceolata.AAC.1